MGERFWPEAKVGVVVLPSAPQGDELLALAHEWTRLGLLGPALWVRPEAVERASGDLPRIRAQVIGTGHDLEPLTVDIDLFDALAEEPLEVVRLVKVRSAVPSREIDARQDAIADTVSEYVRKSLPLVSRRSTVRDQASTLHQLTLICAPTEYRLSTRVDWGSREYGTVVIAAPEDRSSPWSGDAFVRDDERFAGFVLAHVASVAGLWAGTGSGSFELGDREPSLSGSVWISRVFVSAVLTDSLAGRMAARVLADAARPDSLLIDPRLAAPPAGTFFIADELVDGYVTGMVEGAMRLDDGALAFREPAEAGPPPKARIGLRRQLASFFAFSGVTLARIPHWAGLWFSSRSYRQLTRTLHSDDGFAVVGPDFAEALDVRDRVMFDAIDRHGRDRQEAMAEAETPANLAHIGTTPRLWSRLRELVFGALDGSADLADAGLVPVEGTVPVFGRVSDVLALPAASWQPPHDERPEGFPEQLDWHVMALGDPRELLEGSLREAVDRRAEIVAELATIDIADEIARAVADSRTPPPVGPAAPAPPPPAPAATSAAARAELVAELEYVEERARVRSENLEAFDAWAQPQSRSFIWRLLRRLADERGRAQRQLDETLERIDRPIVYRPGELVRLRQGFHQALLVGWITVLGASALFACGLLVPQLEPWVSSIIGWWLPLAGAVGLLITAVALVAYHVGWSRFHRRIDVQRAELADLGRRGRVLRQELARLRSLHRQCVDWLELLSRAIHRPWAAPPEAAANEHIDAVAGRLPFAVQLATVAGDGLDSTQRMRAAMTRHLTVRGWRHDAFFELVREAAVVRGATGELDLTALDEDLPHSANHTRQMLRAALDDESVLERVAARRLRMLVRSAHAEEERGVRPRVHRLGASPLRALRRPDGPAESDEEWDRFLLGSLLRRDDPTSPISPTVLAELKLADGHHEDVESWVVLPERLVAQAAGADARVSARGYSGVADSRAELAWRVDIVGPLPADAIHLWDVAAEPPAASEPARDAGDSGV